MLDQIINKYSLDGKVSPNKELYIPLSIGEVFIEECNKFNIAIIGVEIFNIIDGKVLPSNPIEGIDCSQALHCDIDPSGLLRQGQTVERFGNNNKNDVIRLQMKLSILGYYKGEIDGSFGSQTLAAVNKYKDKYLPDGNKRDNRGVVGASTWQSLGLSLSSSPASSADFKALGSAYNKTSTTSGQNNAGISHETYGNGVSFSFSNIGLRGETSVQYVKDSHGNTDILVTFAGGGGTPGGGVAFCSTQTNANTLDDLKGYGVSIGGTAGGFGVDYVGSSSADKGINFSFGPDGPVEIHGNVTYTISGKDLYNKIKGIFH